MDAEPTNARDPSRKFGEDGFVVKPNGDRAGARAPVFGAR